MKRFVFSLIVIITLTCITYTTQASFNSTISLPPVKEVQYKQAIHSFFDKLTTIRSTSFLRKKFVFIHNKIGRLFNSQTKLKDNDIFVLELIDYTVIERLNKQIDKNKASSSSNISSSTTSIPEPINLNTYKEGRKNITVGELSDPVVKFKVTADLEDIIVEKFAIRTDDENFNDVIEKVYIYDEKGILIGTDRPTSNLSIFNDTFTLEKGDNYLYVALQPFNNDELYANFAFSLEIREATGKTSHQNIHPININNTTDIVYVVPVRIDNIELLESYNGYTIDTTMYNQNKVDLALISFAPQAYDADDDILLRSLEFTLHDGTQTKNVAESLYVQRIDTQSTRIPIDSIHDGEVLFDLNNFGSKAKVSPDTTVVLLITTTPTLDPNIHESIGIELDSRDTNKGVISYTTEDGSTIIDTKSLGYIGSQSVTD